MRKREDARRNREVVIDAALELLSTDPDASMQDIADASGVGRTTVYRHFATRDELFAAMLEHGLDHSWAVARTVFERDEPIEPTITNLSGAMVDVGVRYRFLLGYREPAKLQTSRNASENPIATYFKGAQERGEIRDDFPLAWIMSSFQALVLVAMQDFATGRLDRDDSASLLAQSLLSLFAVNGA